MMDIKQIFPAIRELVNSSARPVVIAIDGGSGAGKSTLAQLIEETFDAVNIPLVKIPLVKIPLAKIPLDDFFSAHIPDSRWREFSIEEKLNNVFRWDAVREDVLKPLRSGREATWFAFDFVSGMRPDGTYGMQKEPQVREPADVVIIEGAYSASPHLEDLVDFSILVDVPVHERHARLDKREDEDFSRSWHEIWDEVEAYYFGEVRPKNSFDLVVRG